MGVSEFFRWKTGCGDRDESDRRGGDNTLTGRIFISIRFAPKRMLSLPETPSG
jgi:hypothetical protein